MSRYRDDHTYRRRRQLAETGYDIGPLPDHRTPEEQRRYTRLAAEYGVAIADHPPPGLTVKPETTEAWIGERVCDLFVAAGWVVWYVGIGLLVSMLLRFAS